MCIDRYTSLLLYLAMQDGLDSETREVFCSWVSITNTPVSSADLRTFVGNGGKGSIGSFQLNTCYTFLSANLLQFQFIMFAIACCCRFSGRDRVAYRDRPEK